MKDTSKVLLVLFVVFILGSSIIAINMPYDPGYDPNNLTSEEIATRSNRFAGTFVFIVNILIIGTMIFMGLRYMFASADAKADIKKSTMAWMIGAVIVFSGTTIVGIVLELVTGNEYINLTFPENTATPSDWANEFWTKAEEYGILPASIKSRAKLPITRMQFAESIYLMAEKFGINLKTPENPIEVSDVKGSSKKKQIQVLYNLGVIAGMGNAEGVITFNPDSSITREDLATMIYRLLVKTGKKSDSITTMLPADKATDVSSYALEAMGYMYNAGIIVGDEHGNLDPKGNTTCEQAMIIMTRIYDQNSSTIVQDASNPDSWAKEFWDKADDYGILPSSIKKKPKVSISRIEFVESVYLLANKFDVDLKMPENPIGVSDVSKSSLKKKIQVLHSIGIIKGTGDADGNMTFNPDGLITRQDAAIMLCRLLKVAGITGLDDVETGTYSEIATKAMTYMNSMGIITGDENGLNPTGNTTCQQAMIIMTRMYDKYYTTVKH